LALQLGRAELEALLEDSYGLARQAAAFGLGELGGEASVRRLDQQLLIEEERGDYDGEAVVEAAVEALGRIDEPSARESLVRRLERMVGRNPERSDLYVLARMLWRRRHASLISAVRRSLEHGSLPQPNGLGGLLVLLEKSPEELAEWARDPAVPVERKTEVLVVLGEDLPDTWAALLPAFISAAQDVRAQALSQKGEAAHYCDRLFALLLLHRERMLGILPSAVRAELRALARGLVGAADLTCASRAASLLKFVGRPEDAAIIEAHRPAHPDLARDFDEIAEAVRNLPES
jgi:hypothetical protein